LSFPIFAAMFFNFPFRHFLLFLSITLLSIGSKATAIDTAEWLDGRTLFKANCAACHNPVIAQTGPALAGVSQRWNDAGDYKGKTGRQWLYAWIRNWNEPVSAGYPYAVKIQNYSASQMNIFPTLSDTDITHILLYVEHSQLPVTVQTHTDADKDSNWDTIILTVLFSLVALSSLVLFTISRRNKRS
jgi:mono/diheme cytochrome c family protein